MWLPEDRDVVAVWQQEQRLRHDRCGTAPWEWEENEDAWVPGHDTCEGCRRLDEYRRLGNFPGFNDGVYFALYRSEHEDLTGN